MCTLRVSSEPETRFQNTEEPPFDENTLRRLFAEVIPDERTVLDLVEAHLRDCDSNLRFDREAAASLLSKFRSNLDTSLNVEVCSAFAIAARDAARSGESLNAYLTIRQARSRHRDRLLRITRTTVLHIFRYGDLTLEESGLLARDVLRLLLPPTVADAILDRDLREVEEMSRAAVLSELNAMLLEATRPKLGEFVDSRKIIARGAYVDLRSDQPPRETVLCRAITQSNFDMATALLDVGADANAVDDDGTTSLMRLVITPNPSLKLIKLLVNASHGVEGAIDRRRNDGATALITAATFGRTLAMTQLIDHGADVSVQMTDGTTALMRAAQMGFSGAIDILCQAKADVHVVNQAGRNALDLAILADRSDRVVDLLKAQGARASQGALKSKQQVDRRQSAVRPPETVRRRATESTSPLARLRRLG